MYIFEQGDSGITGLCLCQMVFEMAQGLLDDGEVVIDNVGIMKGQCGTSFFVCLCLLTLKSLHNRSDSTTQAVEAK